MGSILTIIVFLLVIGVFVSEIYKIVFERRMESKDERGQLLIFKTKSFSYAVLTGGIFFGVALVAIFNLMNKEFFIYYVMLVFFIQSIGSSIYLATVRKV